MPDDLKKLLEDASVGPRRPLEMSRALERARRSRRRRQLGYGTLVLTVLLIPVAVFRASIEGPRLDPPGGIKQSPTPVATKYDHPGDSKRCSAEDLVLDVDWGAAAGTYGADVTFKRRAEGSCRLYKDFLVELKVEGTDRTIASARDLESGGPPWVVVTEAHPAGAFILWSNWCEDSQGPFYYLVHPGQGVLRIDIAGSATCSEGQGTNLSVGGFRRLGD
jgi:hypothetical protein